MIGQKSKVLLVDDEPGILDLIRITLGATRFEVRTATSGAEALEIVPGWRPDLVLLDLMMPDISGYEICQALRAGPDPLPLRIVVLSALGREADRAAALAAGADVYLTKPFSPTALLQMLSELLERR